MGTTKTSVEQYQEQNIKLTIDTNSDTAVLQPGAKGALDASSSSKTWIISGASNSDVSLIATGSGSDSIKLDAASGLTVNVGTGTDSVELGDGTGTVVNTSIIGGEGDKTIIINGNIDPSYVSLGSTLVAQDSVYVSGNVIQTTINSGAGRDSVDINGNLTDKSYIIAGDGNDHVSVKGNVESSSIDMGAGRDSVSITGAVSDSTILGGEGVDIVTITSAVKTSTIDLGAGKDTLLFGAAVTDTTINGGADADSIVMAGGTYSKVDLGAGNDVISFKAASTYGDFSIAAGEGKDTIDASAGFTGTVSLTDYNVAEDVISTGGAYTYDADGNIVIGGGKVNVSKTGEFYAAQIYDGTTTSYVAWSDEDGSTINITDWDKVATLDGRQNNDIGDIIIGGKKNDSIYVGVNDSVAGGAGNDSIDMTATAGQKTQEYVGLATNAGRDTVVGFEGTTAALSNDQSDVLYLYDSNIANLKLENDTTAGALVAKLGTSSVQLNTLNTTTHQEINVKDNSGKTYEVDFVVGKDNITGATDEFADFYYASGTAAELDFSAIDSELVVDLGNRSLNVNGTSLANTDGAFYYGNFASVTGGKDKTVLMGAADAKETLTAGAGDTTLWGGGKKADLLQRGAGTTNTATFFFGDGDGADTISGSTWGNSDSSDVLWLGSTSIKAVKNDGTSATTISLNDGSKLTLAGNTAADTAIKFTMDGENVQQAKIGVSGKSNTWTYEEGVNLYIGGSKNTLKVNNSVDEANIWLDGGTGKAYDSVTTVDASSNSGTVILAGAAANETLIAGQGNSSLWGGGAGNDVLVGNSTGNTTFYFGNGNGNDVISASNTDDKVVLYNTAISDVKAVDDSKSGILKITLNDGSSLTVNNTATSVNTFQLADGSTWKYDASKKSWSQG